MHVIPSFTQYSRRLAQALAVGLLIFGVAFLVACADDQDTQEAPVSPSVPTSAQPTQEAPRSTAAGTSTDAATATPSRPPLQVVATSNIVADWAEVIGGDRVEVFSLHSPGADPHSIVPGAGDVAKVADADVVFSIGLGLEAIWLDDLVRNARADDSKLVALGDGIDPLEFSEDDAHNGHMDEHGHEEDEHGHEEDEHGHEEDEHGHEEDEHGHEEDEHGHEEDEHGHEEDEHGHEEDEHGHEEDEHGHEEDEHGHEEDEHGHEEDEHGHEEDEHGHEEDEHGHEEDEHGHEEDEHGHMDEHGHAHGPLDPHFWFDPNRVKIAVNDIAARLAALDPEGASFYLQNAADYGVQLDELHHWIQDQVELVPPERRLLVTSHDTFAYFADVYGFEVIGALIPSLAPDVEPSAEHIAGLVEVIREHNAPAVFSETTVSGRLPQALARETGAVFAQLYADSLGEKGSAAGTYLGMVRINVERIVEALK